MASLRVLMPEAEELSGIGVAYLAGISTRLYNRDEIFWNLQYREYVPRMD